jgi:uncharacterized protein (TIGR00661 family)
VQALANKRNILVAPLDWGLGHATRCIPLIAELVAHDCNVILAADGVQAAVLQEAFPHLTMLRLHGYGVKYSRKGVLLKIISQVPAIIRAVSKEHVWLQQIVKEHCIDLVISDNRYGLWSPGCSCVLITHQLVPAIPKSLQWANALLRKIMYQQIERFTECWVPDVADRASCLSGSLGHPPVLPGMPVHYMGWLTRFAKTSTAETLWKNKLLIVLSGPEPQRTMLEETLLKQLPAIKSPIFFVRGLPGETTFPSLPANIEVVNHLPAKALQAAMQQSEFVLARGGYSTLMDAFALQKKCIFVPTPGQTEQEYLCQLLQQKNAAICFAQSNFQLANALQQAATFSFELPIPADAGMLTAFVANALQRLSP